MQYDRFQSLRLQPNSKRVSTKCTCRCVSQLVPDTRGKKGRTQMQTVQNEWVKFNDLLGNLTGQQSPKTKVHQGTWRTSKERGEHMGFK